MYKKPTDPEKKTYRSAHNLQLALSDAELEEHNKRSMKSETEKSSSTAGPTATGGKLGGRNCRRSKLGELEQDSLQD